MLHPKITIEIDPADALDIAAVLTACEDLLRGTKAHGAILNVRRALSNAVADQCSPETVQKIVATSPPDYTLL